MLKQLFSIEERRVSALIAGFLITLIFSLIIYYKRGDISSNLASILQALVLGVVGGGAVQALQTFGEYRSSLKSLKEDDEAKSEKGGVTANERPPI